MRVTSNTYPDTLKNQLQYLQQKQLGFQNQISTGLKFQDASQDPVGFLTSQMATSNQDASKAYLNSTQTAQRITKDNYTAMADLQKVMSRASELATQSSGHISPQAQQSIAVEMGKILDQVVSIANRKDAFNNYLFGGTGNVPPVIQTSPGPPPVYAYNPAATYTSNVADVDIANGYNFTTGMVAGRIGSLPAFNGFLTNGTFDILNTLSTAYTQLQAGNAVGTTQSQQLSQEVDYTALNLGKTASNLSALNLNEAALNDQMLSGAKRISDVTQASYTDVITELQRTQLGYQAALQSSGQILSLTLLNYLR